jgi:hypothetical protein
VYVPDVNPSSIFRDATTAVLQFPRDAGRDSSSGQGVVLMQDAPLAVNIT